MSVTVYVSTLGAVTVSDKFRHKSTWYIPSVRSIFLCMPSSVVRDKLSGMTLVSVLFKEGWLIKHASRLPCAARMQFHECIADQPCIGSHRNTEATRPVPVRNDRDRAKILSPSGLSGA